MHVYNCSILKVTSYVKVDVSISITICEIIQMLKNGSIQSLGSACSKSTCLIFSVGIGLPVVKVPNTLTAVFR